MMKYTLQLTIIMALITLSLQMPAMIEGVCTLDEMRLLAVEACEHIFQNDVRHSKQKREISNEIHESSLEETEHEVHPHHHHKVMRVNRKDYPHGGFLLVNHRYAKVLNQMDHDPEYKILPTKSHHVKLLEEMESTRLSRREKRNSDSSDVHLPYCCLNKCRMDHFCMRR